MNALRGNVAGWEFLQLRKIKVGVEYGNDYCYLICDDDSQICAFIGEQTFEN